MLKGKRCFGWGEEQKVRREDEPSYSFTEATAPLPEYTYVKK